MSGIIDRLQDRRSAPDAEARVLPMQDGTADDVLDALSADTSRCVLRALYEEPRTPSELAGCVDTSLQNLHYHLSNLQDAGLVEPLDTVYSEKGNEMTVYGPASDPLVFVGDDERVPQVEQSMTHVAGGLGVLAVASLFVQWGAEHLVRAAGSIQGIAQPAGASTPSGYAPGTLYWMVFDVVEPGVLFFALGLILAAVVTSLTSDR